MASGALPEMVRAISMVAFHSSLSGATRSTRPIRTASAESIRMPVYIRSRAHDGPRDERLVAGADQDHDAHLGIIAQFGQGLTEPLPHVERHGVALFRVVE